MSESPEERTSKIMSKFTVDLLYVKLREMILSAIRSAVEEKEAEIRKLFLKGCVTCRAGNGLPDVRITFNQIEDAQRLHKFLVELKVVSEK